MKTNGLINSSLIYLFFFQGTKVLLPKLRPPIVAITAGMATSIIASFFFFSKKKNLVPEKITSVYPSPTDALQASKPHPIGIANPSCNCWLNALMQFSYHIPRFRPYLTHQFPDIKNFFAAYENAMKQNKPLSSTESSHLRKYLAQTGMNISPSDGNQEDATEAFMQLFGNIPHRHHLLSTIHRTRHYAAHSLDGTRMHSTAQKTSKATTEEIPIIHIPLEENLPFPLLIQNFFTRTLPEPHAEEIVSREGSDRLLHDFPLVKEEVFLPTKPPFLLVSLDRFLFRKTITSIQNPFLQFFFGKQHVSIEKRKITRKVDVPLTLRFQSLFFGLFSKTYQLQACILHKGKSMNSGHYEAFVRKDGEIYLCNDDTITKATEETMLEEAQKDGYLLYYEKI